MAALSLEEKGLVLGAALARTPPAVAAGATGAAGARCAAALAALGDDGPRARGDRRADRAGAGARPAGIERVHPDWLRERLERESSAIVRAVAAGLPDDVRGVAADVLRARGEDARRSEPEAGAPGVAALQRVVFAGLVPLAGAGAPSTPLARELAALAPGEIVRAIETRGAEALGRSLRGAPAGVVARAAASLGDGAGGGGSGGGPRPGGDDDAAPRDRARAMVEAAGVPATGEAAFAIGARATAAMLEDEGAAALLAVAQRLPPALGRRLLAAADGSG